jgi:MerR family transcriptional regulator, thiopeptide resistance regulator
MENSEDCLFTVGELAQKVGATVRTLQYYDRIGLLKSTFSSSGRRLYTREDVLKLQQILFLKSFGFPLEEIKNRILNQKVSSYLGRIFAQQREILLGQISNYNKIVNMLDAVTVEMKAGEEISISKLMTIFELMKQGNPYTFLLHYFGDEQLNTVFQRFESQEASDRFMEQTKGLFARVVSLNHDGVDPAGKEGQKLAEDWWNMVQGFTKGDQSLLNTLIFAGRDMGNWPKGTETIQDAFENFLVKALNIYCNNSKIQIPRFGLASQAIENGAINS